MKSLSCIIPIYGLTVGDNLLFFDKLIHSLSIALHVLNGNYEIVIVNDDKERTNNNLIRQVFLRYGIETFLIYIENSYNIGQAASRNIGANVASKEYLHFIDQDDYISDNFYDEFSKMDSYDDFYISKPYFNINGKTRKAYTYNLMMAYSKASEIGDLWYLLISNLAYSPGQLIILKSSFKDVGGFPVLTKRGADDFALYFNFVFSNRKHFVHFQKDSIFYYRIHDYQNSKLSSTNLSVHEFLNDYTPLSFKEKLIVTFKMKKLFDIFCTLFYFLFFKRAN